MMHARACKTAALALAVLMATCTARASEPLALRPGMGGVPDPGAVECAYLNKLYATAPTGFRQMLLYWLEGYVYGRTGRTMDAALASAPGGPWTFDTLTDRLVDYCGDHPEADVPAAAADLWRALNPAP
jgi:hypothetical protein